MITTVTLNPAIDKIVEINQLSLGQVHRVSHQVVSLGGKSINVARILAGFGGETKAICFAGKDNYDEILTRAQDDHIPIDPIKVNGATRTNVKIVEPDQNYRTTDVNEVGFKITQEELDKMTDLIIEQGKKSEYLVLSGSLPEGVPKDYYKKIALDLKNDTKVIIDADGEILNAGIEGAPFLIKPNIHELEAALNVALDTYDKIVENSRKLINQHKVGYVLVSMGEDGSILVGENIALRAEILPVKVVSTVGAGDSMLAGVIFGLTKFQALEEEERLTKALSYGVASSSIAISTQNHVAIQEDELVKQAQDVSIKRLVHK
jgi:1-phosphofructokinase